MFTLAQGGCDSHRCHNKKPRIGNRTEDVNDVMPENDGLRFLGILKKAES